MATVAKFQRNGSDVVNCNGSTIMLAAYEPSAPNKLPDGRYDLVTRIADKFEIIVEATTLDAVANALGNLDRYLFEASLHPANYLEFVWQPDTLTNDAKVTVYEGGVRRTGRPETTNEGKYHQRATVEFMRDPVWLGDWTAITFDAATPGTIDNDDTGYVVLPTLDGDLPAPCRFIIASSGGNTANAKRALASLSVEGGANFSHILQVEAADVLYGSLSDVSSTNYSPGSGGVTAKRYSAPDTTFRQLALWEITANLDAWKATYLALLRAKENTTAANYQVRFRAGDIVGGEYVPGPWATATKIRTPLNTTTSGSEMLLLPLGIVRTPRAAGREMPSDGVYFELYGGGLSAAGSLDLDNLFLFRIGECGAGLGLIAAQFALAMDAGNFAFDSRPGYPQAYMHDGTDFLTGAASLAQGGPLYLMPQVAGQRVYFLVTRNESSAFKHDRANTLTITGHYQPRWVHMAGTN